MARDNMKSCYYCDYEDSCFNGRGVNHWCKLGHRLKYCGDFQINPIWEPRRGIDGFLLPREQWPDVIEFKRRQKEKQRG